MFWCGKNSKGLWNPKIILNTALCTWCNSASLAVSNVRRYVGIEVIRAGDLNLTPGSEKLWSRSWFMNNFISCCDAQGDTRQDQNYYCVLWIPSTKGHKSQLTIWPDKSIIDSEIAIRKFSKLQTYTWFAIQMTSFCQT